MKIGIVNGPNLNMLGHREPDVYGSQTLGDIEHGILSTFGDSDLDFAFRQSNHEGELVDILQSMALEWKADGLVLNPGAYAHTSIALRDCIAALDCPVVEVHISNTAARERFRRSSLTAGACVGKIEGLGWTGYLLAVMYLATSRRSG